MNAPTRGPWSIATELPDQTTILGADGFPVGFAHQIAILPRYDEKLRVDEWQSHPGKAFVTRPVDEARANARTMALSIRLYEALRGMVGLHDNPTPYDSATTIAAARSVLRDVEGAR